MQESAQGTNSFARVMLEETTQNINYSTRAKIISIHGRFPHPTVGVISILISFQNSSSRVISILLSSKIPSVVQQPSSGIITKLISFLHLSGGVISILISFKYTSTWSNQYTESFPDLLHCSNQHAYQFPRLIRWSNQHDTILICFWHPQGGVISSKRGFQHVSDGVISFLRDFQHPASGVIRRYMVQSIPPVE